MIRAHGDHCCPVPTPNRVSIFQVPCAGPTTARGDVVAKTGVGPRASSCNLPWSFPRLRTVAAGRRVSPR